MIRSHEKINLVGMLIGPKGMYHKMLEEISGCHMFIKGRNAMNPDNLNRLQITGIAAMTMDMKFQDLE